MRRGTTLVVICLLAASACSSGGSDRKDDPFQGIAPRSGVVSRLLQGRVSLSVSGAVTGTWEGETPINVLTNVGGDVPIDLWQLTVGILPEHILEVEDGLKIRPAFDLLSYDGAGTYSVKPADDVGLTDEELEEIRENPDLVQQNPQAVLRSAIVFVVSHNDVEVTNYNAVQEPCTVKVATSGNEGSVQCPRVSNGTDEVSFRWSWEADPDDVLADLTQVEDNPDSGSASSTSSPPGEGSTPQTTTPNGGTGSPGPTGKQYGLSAPYKLEVDINPSDCATVGNTVTMAVDTIPDASITLVLVYPDAKPHGGTIVGQTGVTGDFNWATVVPPDAPQGQVDLLVNVTPNETNQQHRDAGGGLVEGFELRSSC